MLKKPARKHAHWKDKPEPRTEQGKRKEALHKEVEMFPPIKVSGDTDDERNSRISLETMDTDQCMQKLVRTNKESSKCTQCKIEETIQYWAQEKKGVMNYRCALELNNTVSNKRVQQLYSEDQPQEVIDQAE